jgi:hypothetical protein
MVGRFNSTGPKIKMEAWRSKEGLYCWCLEGRKPRGRWIRDKDRDKEIVLEEKLQVHKLTFMRTQGKEN